MPASAGQYLKENPAVAAKLEATLREKYVPAEVAAAEAVDDEA